MMEMAASPTRLAKPLFDVALNTADWVGHQRFWQTIIGLTFEECLQIGPDAYQYRFDMGGAVLKICVYPSVLERPPGGYRELSLVRTGVESIRQFDVPGGGRLRIVPPGTDNVTNTALRLGVRDPTAHRKFFSKALGFDIDTGGDVRIGDGRLILDSDRSACPDAGLQGPGWRCITLQISKLDDVFRRAVSAGAKVEVPPTRFADIAKYAMLSDPDGNWIELSQRATLTGPLD